MNRWSHAEGDIVDVDVIDYEDRGAEMCEDCNCYVADDEVKFEDGASYCPGCYADAFGEEF